MSRVVVTGMGMITPLGVGVKHTWKNLVAGKSGLISTTSLSDYEAAGWATIPSKVIGKVPEGPISEGKWDSEDHFPSSESRRLARFSQYALAATKEALTDANYFPQTYEQQTQTGVAVGSGIGSFDDSYQNAVNFHNNGGFKKVQPLFIPKLLTNMAAGNISIKYGLKGVNHSVSSACATGLQSIGDAYNFIKLGHSKVMVCGGTEATINPLALAGFARAKSVCVDSNDSPTTASRPFDGTRNGFVLAEGCGIMILEDLEHALARGVAKDDIYAEIVGYGLSGDAHHITAPPEDGNGAQRSMNMALDRAQVDASEVDYINAHATSTALGDRAENNAISEIFRDNAKLSISSTKSSIGHLLGAAGAVESIFTVLSVKENVVPPTLNLQSVGSHKDDDVSRFGKFDYVPHEARTKTVSYALNNSFGFGGVNSSLLFAKYKKD